MCRVLIVSRFAFPPRSLHFERGLKLRLQIVRAPQRHLRIFHQLQERRLHATSADVATNQISGRRDLVDFIDVDNAELRERDITIRLVHELADKIFHITTDVAGFAELRRVRLDERHFDQIGDVLDQVGFPDAGRADEYHVLLRILRLVRARWHLPARVGAGN